MLESRTLEGLMVDSSRCTTYRTFPSSTITLDVLSLSTGLPHPASVGQLEAPPLIDAVHRHTDNWLSVSGPHVGLIKRSIFNAGFCEIRVWDWKTGEVKLVSTNKADLSQILIKPAKCRLFFPHLQAL